MNLDVIDVDNNIRQPLFINLLLQGDFLRWLFVAVIIISSIVVMAEAQVGGPK